MHAELDVIEAQVLKLSPADRARLLDRMIVSIDEGKSGRTMILAASPTQTDNVGKASCSTK
jgi:hypothetical protein